MKKAPNSETAGAGGDKRLPRSRILRGRTNFQRIFSRSTAFRATCIDMRFRIYDDADEGIKFGFVVPRRLGKAVRRNRCKRRMREAYRIQQHLITDLIDPNAVGLHAVFISKDLDADFTHICNDIEHLLNRLRQHLNNNYLNDRASSL